MKVLVLNPEVIKISADTTTPSSDDFAKREKRPFVSKFVVYYDIIDFYDFKWRNFSS